MATKDSGGAQEQEHEKDEDGRQDQLEKTRNRSGQEGGAAEARRTMDPNNREQGDNTQDMSAATLTGEEGGTVQGLTEAMAAVLMFDFEGDPIPTPGLVGDADADLEATQQHHQPRPLEPLPSATTTGAAGATGATGATGTDDHDGAATSLSGPGAGFRFGFGLASGTKLNEATTKTPGTGAAFNFGSP